MTPKDSAYWTWAGGSSSTLGGMEASENCIRAWSLNMAAGTWTEGGHTRGGEAAWLTIASGLAEREGMSVGEVGGGR